MCSTILAKHIYTSPHMNTHVGKHAFQELFEQPLANHVEDHYNFYTLPEALVWPHNVIIVVNKMTNDALQYIAPEVAVDQKREKREKREKAVREARVKLLVKIKRVLQYAHKFSINHNGKIGIKWWGPHGPLRDTIVKKEEPEDVPLQIKKEEPDSPKLVPAYTHLSGPQQLSMGISGDLVPIILFTLPNIRLNMGIRQQLV